MARSTVCWIFSGVAKGIAADVAAGSSARAGVEQQRPSDTTMDEDMRAMDRSLAKSRSKNTAPTP
jgi:hypothetical protein